jgi:hypothetical protein
MKSKLRSLANRYRQGGRVPGFPGPRDPRELVLPLGGRAFYKVSQFNLI